MRNWTLEAEELHHQLENIKENDEKNLFYKEKVFPWTKERMQAADQLRKGKEPDILFLSVGTSYEPLVLSILSIQPKQVVFLHTEGTTEIIDTIAQHVNLSPSQYRREQVDKTDIDEMYRSVRRVLEGYPKTREDGEEVTVAVDITGGTKAMAGGLAMAGTMIHATVYYIESDFDQRTRKPKPGSERLETIANPFSFWADVDLNRAKGLWDQRNYFGAHSLFAKMADDIPTRIEYAFLAKLSLAYHEMENINMASAADQLNESIAMVNRHGRDFSLFRDKRALIEKLEKQLELVGRLQEAFSSEQTVEKLRDIERTRDLLFFFFHLGIVREERKNFDIASLYHYRMIEMVSQHRLAVHGLHSSKAEYDKLGTDLEALKERAHEVSKENNFKNNFERLDKKISLLQGYILLRALNDSAIKKLELKKLNNAIEARNSSILAHGYRQITEEDYRPIRKIARQLLDYVNPDLKYPQIDERIKAYQPVDWE